MTCREKVDPSALDQGVVDAMKTSRRTFLKLAGSTGAGLMFPLSLSAAEEAKRFPLHKPIGEVKTICPYCSVGCGILVATDTSGHIINAEGDPDHIINRGSLCPKGISVAQTSTSPLRLKTVKYRAPGSSRWEDRDWDWALREIAKRIRTTRDQTFQERDANGVKVNRTEAIAWLGGATNNNEEAYLAVKLMRALGLVYVEHQARI
jgi:formate dehydrogenase major subunit